MSRHRVLTALAAAILALPYRALLARVGRRPRLLPLLLLSGRGRVHLGDDVRTEPFVSLVAGAGGRIDIGARCELGPFARLDADAGHITLGDDTSVNAFCVLNGFGGLDIGRRVRIASHTVILSSTHQHADVTRTVHEQGIAAQPTAIGDGAWLGAHVVVIGGVRVGEHSIVGAGAVVTEDVPPYAVVAGVPARVVHMRTA